ncbi:MAG: hypothetical protein KF802_02390 [Bdellovibrionaceae bacterium]|nr:hypothetical protein [Pseudobdellovibrionaceae bacterium]
MTMNKRQDLIDALKFGVTLPNWATTALKDPFAVITLARIKKAQEEAKNSKQTIEIIDAPLKFAEKAGISRTKFKEIISLFIQCSIIKYISPEERVSHTFVIVLNPEDMWFTTGPIPRPDTTNFMDLFFPDILWNKAFPFADATPLIKLAWVFLVKNLDRNTGRTFIAHKDGIENHMGVSAYKQSIYTFVNLNIIKDKTHTTPNVLRGYRTFDINNPAFWNQPEFQLLAEKENQMVVSNAGQFDHDALLDSRKKEARAIRRVLTEQWIKSNEYLTLGSNEDERDLGILSAFYGLGILDYGFPNALDVFNRLSDKTTDKPVSRKELTEALDQVCSDATLLKANPLVMFAEARKRLKKMAPTLNPEEIDIQMALYKKTGKFNLDPNYRFPFTPKLVVPTSKGGKKKGGKAPVQITGQSQAKIDSAKNYKNKPKTQTITGEVVKSDTLIEGAVVTPTASPYIKQLDAPKVQEAPAPVAQKATTTERPQAKKEILMAIKFPFCLIQRVRNEKDLENLRNFVPSPEDRKEADRQVKANAESAQEFCEEIGRTDIIEKYYFSSIDMAKFHSILNFFRKDAHIWPLDDLEFYLKNYDDFDWWAITQDGMPRHKHLM